MILSVPASVPDKEAEYGVSPSVSVIETRTIFVFVVAKFELKLDVWFVNEADGKWLAIIVVLIAWVVVVPNVLVNVIVESKVSPLWVTEPLKLNPNDNVPLPFIEICELDDAQVPLWF